MATFAAAPATHQNDSLRSARIGAIAAFIGTIPWLVLGVDSIVRPMQDNRRDAWWFLAFIPTFIAFWCLGEVHRGERSRFERVTFWMLIFGSLLAAIGQCGNVFNIPALQKLGFPLGALVWMAGMIAYGVAIWRSRLLPRFAALALILWEPGSIATGLALAPISPLHERGGYSAGLEKGLATFLIGLGMYVYSKSRNQAAVTSVRGEAA